MFISYRRRFDRASARLLRLELIKAFGDEAVFRDVEDIAPGDVFPQRIEEAVKACDTFLALISPGWLETAGNLQNPDDFVRVEIATALARNVRVIPLLLNGAQMPPKQVLPAEISGLALRQARELSDDRWDDDIRRLLEAIRPPRRRPLRGKLSAAARFLFATWPGRAALAVLLLAALLPALPRLSTVETDPATTPAIESVRFDAADDCGAWMSCFWVDTAAGGGVRTGTLFGSGLRGGTVELWLLPGPRVEELKTLADGSGARSLRFSFRLAEPVPPGTRLSFGVSKPVRQPDESVLWSVNGKRHEFEVAFVQPTPGQAEGVSAAGCFESLLPAGRWIAMEYGTPEYGVVVRRDQPLGGTAGVLLTEYGRRVGAVTFQFVWSGKDEVGNDTGFFRVEKVVGSDCRPTENYENLSHAANKNMLNNYDYLGMRLDERRYDLRVAYRPDKTIAARFAGKTN